ncbi:MAG TPA: pentapeptide repeat-containing protein [Methylocystis sp.]|nr:pentapeptide repeat-containing protein [Methylocystis sp.]
MSDPEESRNKSEGPPPRQRQVPPDLSPILAEKADDLESLKKTVEDAAAVSGGLWLSYLFVLFYFAVAAGAVTHVDLLLENPVKLPFLGVELPLKGFFFLTPLLFLVSHGYTLAQFRLLAYKAKRFHDQLFKQVVGERNAEMREGLLAQLPSDIFVQFLTGPTDLREGWFGWLLEVIALVTLVISPPLLLLLLQIQFLPYHDPLITLVHRLALVLDLALIWWLWGSILSERSEFRRRRAWLRWAAPALGVVSGFVAFLFSWTVAFFPSEPQERFPSPLLPAGWIWRLGPSELQQPDKLVTLHDGLFHGEIDNITRRRKSLFSDTLVAIGFDLYAALQIDDPEKVNSRDRLFSLRNRDLIGAVLDHANLPRVEFNGAYMQGASLVGAKLRGAWLEYANLQGSLLLKADLLSAQMRGTQLQGADLGMAQLQGAHIWEGSQLQGASLWGAQLQGADLGGANLDKAQLQGASLEKAQLQGANLDANLTAASLAEALVWRTRLSTTVLSNLFAPSAGLNWYVEYKKSLWEDSAPWTNSDYDMLRSLIKQALPEGEAQIDALKGVATLDCNTPKLDLAPCDPNAKTPEFVREARKKIENASVDEDNYAIALKTVLAELACHDDDNAVFAVRGMAANGRIAATRREARALVSQILSRECPVSAKLTREDKERLSSAVKEAAENAREPAEKVKKK